MSRRGFTLVEVIVALVLLAIVLLSLGRFVGSFVRDSNSSRVRIMAVGVAQERLELIRADPRYQQLVGLYNVGPGADTLGFNGYPSMRRRTRVVRDQSGTPARDMTTITVTVTEPGLRDPVSLTSVVAAP